MYRLAKYVWSYFKTDEEDGVIKRLQDISNYEDYLSDIHSNKQIKLNEQLSVKQDECKETSGVITHIETNFGKIDNELVFSIDAAAGLSLKVNNVVQYLLFEKENGNKYVKKIISVQHDFWDENIDDCNPAEFKEPDRVIDIHTRTITTKVLFRYGRILKLSDGNMDCNLDHVDCNFVPIVGDIITLEAKVTSDDKSFNYDGDTLEYYKLRPCINQVDEYTITSYDIHNSRGVAGDKVFFYKESLIDGYVPAVGDKVIIDSIQSEQGNYNSRALSLVLIEKKIAQQYKKNADYEIINLIRPKNNITIDAPSFVAKDLNEQQILHVTVHNKGSDPQWIHRAHFYLHSKDFQLKILSPRSDKVIELRPRNYVQYKVRGEAKFFGYSKELIVFSFPNFVIGTYINISVGIDEGPKSIHRSNLTAKDRSNKLRDNRLLREVDIIPGRRIVKGPAFVINRLPPYKLPDYLVDAVIGKNTNIYGFETISESISNAAPYLTTELNEYNYRDMFHTLLFLNEIDQDLKMRQYDMDRAHFTHTQGFLSLEIENLSERRPSLIMGDSVVAVSILDETKTPHEGVIHKVMSNSIWLLFNTEFHSSYSGEDYVVKFNSSRTSYRRCHQAVDLAHNHLRAEVLFPNKVCQKVSKIDFKIEDDDLLTRDEKRLKLKAIQEKEMSKNKKEKKDPIVDKLLVNVQSNQLEISSNENDNWTRTNWFNSKLNPLQKEAVKNVLLGEARPMPYIIFGPPGTGKTITVVETILQILKLIPNSRILLASPSNSSANLLTTRLMEYGLQPGDMVRVVAHYIAENDSIPSDIAPYCATIDVAREGTRDSLTKTLASGVRLCVPKTHLSRYRLIIGTCICLGQLQMISLPPDHFTHIIVDEAGQATEPEIMVALTQVARNNGQIILAGDPMQLGPIISSNFAKEFGLGESFLQRLLERYPYRRDPASFAQTGGYVPQLVTRLTYNYRSVPEILKLSSDMFYDSELIAQKSQTEGADAEILTSLSDLLPTRTENGPPSVIFHGIKGDNIQTSDSPSWFNIQEAGQVLCFLVKLYKRNLKPEDIGIITPYQKQVQYLRTLINDINLPEPKIGSVEEFQGQERSVIIISTVRSRKTLIKTDIRHALGFVQSPKRLNVSLTRAKSLLIIIGNPHLLAIDDNWCNVIKYCVDSGGYIGCDLPTKFLNKSESL